MTSGVYQIVNTATGDEYIGSAFDCERRRASHISSLRCGTHRNEFLREAAKTDGWESFKFHVLEECPISDLAVREELWITERRPAYNIAKKCRNRPVVELPRENLKVAIYSRIDREAVDGLDRIAESMDPQPTRAQLIDRAVREFVERNGKRRAK